MGIWSCAEITSGILVSCFPSMPRFFQHFGPKIYGTHSLWSKLKSRPKRKSVFSGSSSGSKAVLAQKLSFDRQLGAIDISLMQNDPCNSKSELKDEHLEVGARQSMPQDHETFIYGTTSLAVPFTSTRRNELETGQSSIHTVTPMHCGTRNYPNVQYPGSENRQSGW